MACSKGKVALFAFNGDLMCFVHVMLNALDLREKGYDVKLIIEGSATKLVPEFSDLNKPFASLYQKGEGSKAYRLRLQGVFIQDGIDR